MKPLPTLLLLARRYAPHDRAAGLAQSIKERGHRVEVVAEAPGAEEFMHLDASGCVVHRISAARSVLPYSARIVEKVFELETLWNRDVSLIGDAATDEPPALLRNRLRPVPGDGASLSSAQGGDIRSVELICCTYNRLAEPLAALPGMLAAADASTAAGVATTVRVVYQDADFTDRLYAERPEWRKHAALVLTHSSPPSLPRARNAGLALSEADLVIFVDDDVELDPGFLSGHIQAANAHPEAVCIAGRIRSRVMGADRTNTALAIGQVRLSGQVDDNFDSVGDANLTIVTHTPRGANMAFRRELLVNTLGAHCFDEGLKGSAHREETTLGVELSRRGLLSVFAPSASLLHLESESGGCENRGKRSVDQRVAQLALDYLFLHRLYAPTPVLRSWAPLLLGLREVRHAPDLARKVFHAWLNVNAFREGRRQFKQRAADRDLDSVASPPLSTR